MPAGERSIFPVTPLKPKIPSEWRKFLPLSVRPLCSLAPLLVTQGRRSFARSHDRHQKSSRVHQRYNNASGSMQILTLRADRLKSTRFDLPDIIDHITQCFDESTKRLFRSLDEASYIQFGSPFETEVNLGIQRGKMKLSGFVLVPSELVLYFYQFTLA